MPERGVTYGLKYQARSVAAVQAGDKRSRWLVGTVSLREENEVSSLPLPLGLRMQHSSVLISYVPAYVLTGSVCLAAGLVVAV